MQLSFLLPVRLNPLPPSRQLLLLPRPTPSVLLCSGAGALRGPCSLLPKEKKVCTAVPCSRTLMTQSVLNLVYGCRARNTVETGDQRRGRQTPHTQHAGPRPIVAVFAWISWPMFADIQQLHNMMQSAQISLVDQAHVADGWRGICRSLATGTRGNVCVEIAASTRKDVAFHESGHGWLDDSLSAFSYS